MPRARLIIQEPSLGFAGCGILSAIVEFMFPLEARLAGKFDVLEVETRGIKNPRTYDPTGIPFHADGRTIKEHFYLDKNNANLLHLELTTIDNALTRPWSAIRVFQRVVTNKPIWWREDLRG